jgi:hypothetical protein
VSCLVAVNVRFFFFFQAYNVREWVKAANGDPNAAKDCIVLHTALIFVVSTTCAHSRDQNLKLNLSDEQNPTRNPSASVTKK